MKHQPNFDQLAESNRVITQHHGDMANQISPVANLPAINYRQVAQNHHNELMGAIRAVETNLSARMDRLETRFGGLETRFNGLEMRLMARYSVSF